MSVYLGISGVAREVDAVDLSVSALAHDVDAGYLGVDGIAREVFGGGNTVGSLGVGSSVYMNVDGVSKEFIVVQQGLPEMEFQDYDISCDGTWLLMKEPFIILSLVTDDGSFIGENLAEGTYTSTIFHRPLLPAFIDSLDPAIINTVKTVKIPYWDDVEDYHSCGYMPTDSGLETQAFLLSATEIGNYSEDGLYPEGTTLDYFINASDSDRIAYYNGTACAWYTRTAGSVSSMYRVIVNTNGYSLEISHGVVTILGITKVGVRPALILPFDTAIDENYNVIA